MADPENPQESGIDVESLAAFGGVEDSPLWNRDIAPVPANRRHFGKGSIAALWIGMSVCVPTYMLAASQIAGGMSWWQALLTITLGNVIVLIPMVLNAHAGTKYGIPFPVFARASFGVLGANIPALLRAIVACGWFGIQTWIGGAALYQLLAVLYPEIKDTPHMPAWISGDYHLEAADLYVSQPDTDHEMTATGTITSVKLEKSQLRLSVKGDKFRVALTPTTVVVQGDHSPAQLSALQIGKQVWIIGEFKGTRLNEAQFFCFLFFWLLNMIVVWAGIETIRWFENLSAPFLLIIGTGLLIWACREAHGFGPMFSQGSKFKSAGEFFAFFF
ncbi:MAG: cytosine permease, partial [bacterium]